jgi:nitroimidazol reductase NimA-like FMN-containing flavoprotein (pyridoxamine 5'-phosphate oxidase superfamily)
MKSLKPQIPLKVITNNLSNNYHSLVNFGKTDKVEKLEKHLRELKKKNKTDYRVLLFYL